MELSQKFYMPLERVRMVEKVDGVYTLEAECLYGKFTLRSESGPKPERDYLGLFDCQISPDFVGDNPRDMEVGTVSPTLVEILEVRKVITNLDYTSNK